jgi:hypothetical protein
VLQPLAVPVGPRESVSPCPLGVGEADAMLDTTPDPLDPPVDGRSSAPTRHDAGTGAP